MYYKYKLYVLLVWLGFSHFITLRDKTRYTLGVRYLEMYLSKCPLVDTTPAVIQSHPVFLPYLNELLHELAEQGVNSDRGTLLRLLFLGVSREHRSTFAYALLTPPIELHSEILALTRIMVSELSTRETTRMMEAWLKDVPEYSRLTIPYHARKKHALKENQVKELLTLLENMHTRISLNQKHFHRCNSREEIVATAKELLYDHYAVTLEVRGSRFGIAPDLALIAFAMEEDRSTKLGV